MTFLDLLQSRQTLLMDGAMGTELMRRGYRGPTWRANLDVTDLVHAIHIEFESAGAEVLLTNTFLVPSMLDERGMVHETITRAETLAVGYRLASLGPMRKPDFPDIEELLRRTAGFTAVDGFLLETCSDLSALAAATAIAERTAHPVIVSFSYRTDPATGDARTTAGMSPETIAEVVDGKIAGLGVNCGLNQSPAQVADVVRRYRTATSLPLLARPNAGSPGSTLSPENWARETAQAVNAGATLIGGCCGTTPEHIRELATLLGKRPFSG